MLSNSETLKVCKRAERVLRPVLGIGAEWSVFWFVREKGDNFRGECGTQPEYRRSVINIYINNIDSVDELIEVAAHELCHVSQWPFDLARELITDSQAGEIEKKAWSHAYEQHVQAVLMQTTAVRAAIKQLQRESRSMKR